MPGRIACLALLQFAGVFAAEIADSDETLAAAQALLLWQVSTHKISPDSSMHFSVSVDGHDLPPAAVEAMRRRTGITFAPGSAFVPENGATVGNFWNIGIGKPTPRSDGDYDLTWGYYCGMLCASGNTATLHHDATGWHVVESRMHWVS